MWSHNRFCIKSSCYHPQKRSSEKTFDAYYLRRRSHRNNMKLFSFFGARKELGKKNMEAYFILRNHAEFHRKTIRPFNIPSRYERFRRKITTLFWSANLSKVQYKSYRIISSSNQPYGVL